MHPGFHSWWRRAHEAREAAFGGQHPCAHDHDSYGPEGWFGPRGPGRGRHGHGHGHGGGPDARFGGFDDDASAGFGVRRPLRFLAHKLDLEEAQVATLAAILSDLKTERAQASVDNRRRIGSVADALEGETFEESKLSAIATDQLKTDERLQAAITKALGRIHAMLEPEQRKRLAYLLRTGVLSI